MAWQKSIFLSNMRLATIIDNFNKVYTRRRVYTEVFNHFDASSPALPSAYFRNPPFLTLSYKSNSVLSPSIANLHMLLE